MKQALFFLFKFCIWFFGIYYLVFALVNYGSCRNCGVIPELTWDVAYIYFLLVVWVFAGRLHFDKELNKMGVV